MTTKPSFWTERSRNFRTSARLHLQHFIAQNTVGHLLDSEVEKAVAGSQDLKIAELACGNGVWLTDLHTDFSKKGISFSQLDGYDINPGNFPNPSRLPKSVTLRELDILARPLPAEMLGIYDVVHVRGFVSIVYNNDTTPLLSTALALLKPGGYLQWEEAKGDGFVAEAPSPDISTTNCEAVLALMNTVSHSRGIVSDWVDVMDQHLKKQGFEDVRMSFTKFREQDLKAWTEDILMVWDELEGLFPSKEEDPNAKMTREAWVDLFYRAVGETEQGVVVHMKGITAVVGRKAS
ncbi:hypothetical protein F4805DRAFT_298976 [Annulohypoxylon moriforme]|nr:hypothetical protein F4805DRAFT_298976 [Annulohypoxylon moriforme]